MRFLMLVCRDESIALGPDERAAIGPAVEAWVVEMENSAGCVCSATCLRRLMTPRWFVCGTARSSSRVVRAWRRPNRCLVSTFSNVPMWTRLFVGPASDRAVRDDLVAANRRVT